MLSKADMQDALQVLAADSATHRAQLIGLAAVIAHLPGVSTIDRGLVDAAIEDECRHRSREDRDTAHTFAHSILQTARETAATGVYGAQEAHMRGYQRGA